MSLVFYIQHLNWESTGSNQHKVRISQVPKRTRLASLLIRRKFPATKHQDESGGRQEGRDHPSTAESHGLPIGLEAALRLLRIA